MQRPLLPIAAMVVCLAGAAAYAAPRPEVARIIVQERGAKAYGSGTLIDCRDRYGLVVSNWHVVRDAVGKIEVVFPDGFRSEARAVKLDEHWDLAALVIWRPRVAPARIASRPPRPGEPLTICGYGQGEYREATGRCTDFYSPEPGMPHELVELSVQARQGDSGGPILNSDGELAGVLFGAGQGTTLGSFGPRVEMFVASLAPDIGRDNPDEQTPSTPALIAHAPVKAPKQGAGSAWQKLSGPRPLAEVAACEDGRCRAAEDAGEGGFAAWRSVVDETPTTPTPKLPIVASITQAPASAPVAGPFDWFDVGRNLLAAVGAGFLLLHLLKLAG